MCFFSAPDQRWCPLAGGLIKEEEEEEFFFNYGLKWGKSNPYILYVLTYMGQGPQCNIWKSVAV